MIFEEDFDALLGRRVNMVPLVAHNTGSSVIEQVAVFYLELLALTIHQSVPVG